MDSAWIDPDVAGNPRHKLLTARLVLSHRTGLPNWRAASGLKFAHDPGGAWEYSGEGFQYVARFTEHKMNQSLDVLAQKYVFGPLGMKDSAYVGQTWFKGRIAVPTDASGKTLVPSIARQANAADLVYTTPRDYAAFMIGVLRDKGLTKSIAAERSQSQVSMMDIACQGAKASSCPKLVGFGLGWQVLLFEQENILMHTGKDEGVFTFVYLNKTTQDGVVVFTNSDNGYKIVLPILDRSGTSREFLAFLRGQLD